MATTPKSLAIVVSAVAKDTAVIATIDQHNGIIVKQEVERSVENLVSALPSPPSLGPSCSWDKITKSHRDENSKKKKSNRFKASVLLSEKEAWFLKGLLKKVKSSPGSSRMCSDAKKGAPELKVLHTTDSHVRNVVN